VNRLDLFVLEGLTFCLDMENPAVDLVSVEHADGFEGVILGREQDSAKATGLAIESRSHVGTNHHTGGSEEILQVLPLGSQG
jgi:hypothetical protein